MGSAGGAPRSGKRKHWALAPVLFLIALLVGAGLAPRLWPRGSRQDPRRLDLLQSAWSEFAAQRYDRATAILDRRTAEIAPTALDCMLRARIAEAQGRVEEALDHLKQI